MAQVGLWVQRDIVEAIAKTNEQASDPRQKGVPGSAVKRLVRTQVDGYALKGGGRSGGLGGYPGASPAGGTGGVDLTYLTGANRNTPAQNEPYLTRRHCDKLRDVVHYEFTVVLPARHLVALQKNLLKRNYHTVLSVKVDQPGSVQTAPPGAGRGGSWQPTGEDMFYYGPDPVVQVTVTGELQLMTDWTRGRELPIGADEEAAAEADPAQWAYPPLMPDAFLRAMAEMDPNALRPVDATRIGGLPAGGSPGGMGVRRDSRGRRGGPARER
jgi:hypothetical protein